MGRGLLHLTVLSAKDLIRHDRFGKQQCYVEIQLGSRVSRSKTCKAGGQNPVWNETLFLQLGNEQHIDVRVFVDRLLMKDVQIGAATLSLENVLLNGYDDAVLPLVYKGQQHGSLSLTLDRRSSGTSITQHSHGSSGSSLASPSSSASIAHSFSGSLGNSFTAGNGGPSFTGPTGLKQPSLPIMLLQQPSLALYREQLLQQSALLAQQQQQQQQQQQRALSRSSAGSGAGTGAGSSGVRAGDSGSRKLQWTPKKTAADLFSDPSAVNRTSDAPDLLGMFAAANSTFSDYDSHYSQAGAAAHQPVDAARVQALVDAVYGKGGGVMEGAAQATAAIAAGPSAGAQGSSTTMGASMGLGLSSSAPTTSATAAVGVHTVGASEVGQQSAAGSVQSLLPTVALPGSASGSAQAGASSSTASAGASAPQPSAGTATAAQGVGVVNKQVSASGAAGVFTPDAMQAAAAAFAVASSGALLLGSANSTEDSCGGGDPNAFLAGVGFPAQSGFLTAPSMPDPFGAFGGMRAAAAAAAAALPGYDMPNPFGAGHMHAAEAAGLEAIKGDMPDPFGAGAMAAAAAAAAAAGFAGPGPPGNPAGLQQLPDPAEASMRPEQLAQTTTGGMRPPRSSRGIGRGLQTVIEVSESPSTSSVRLHVVGSPALPSTGAAGQHMRPAQYAGRAAGQDGGSVSPAQTARSSHESAAETVTSERPSQDGSLLQEQVTMLMRQLQERDLLVQQLQEQLQQTQQQLQELNLQQQDPQPQQDSQP